MRLHRCFTEKKPGFDVEAKLLAKDLTDYPKVNGLDSVRILNRYDVEGISDDIYEAARDTVFSLPQTDEFYDEAPPDLSGSAMTLTIEALPGQYDQRADSCSQCLQIFTKADRPAVQTAKMYVFYGELSSTDMEKIRRYLINPVESREAPERKPDTLYIDYPKPQPVETLVGFIEADESGLRKYRDDYSLAMDAADLRLLHSYFRDTEKRDPTITELRVIDTYWSDHCRHTTFFTHLKDITISDPEVRAAYNAYLEVRREVYGDKADTRPQTLMDLATIAAKVFRSRGLLTNIEISEEVNACSIHIDAVVDGKTEDWLLMFKNETHNHPTEVEPFGGAATCVGGAIRDPLSGRAYVYHAMRVTGAGDPRAPIEETLPDKLPQRQITLTAARGNSSYGNQVGLTAGLVHEIYHPGYIAKRMELGAVVGAVKAENVVRETPKPGDKVILLGGRTGRDGIGGATGSSKSQSTETLVTMAAEVQKGNAAEERKIQRLFLDPEVTKMIKKCNDFGAGGVSVAVGELADGLDIDLSLVRLKYEGLDGTEIAISESQERMAVVTAPGDVDAFISKAAEENLEAYVIAEVTESPRMVMHFNGDVIVDISREFLSTNGAAKQASVHVPVLPHSVEPVKLIEAEQLESLVRDLRFCSQRGLHEMFDDTVGAASVLVKSGGKTQSTPIQAMAALLPVRYDSETTTCSVMAYGYDPYLSSENPFSAARAAVVTSVAKLVAAGCDPETAYLSFQEYFESLGADPEKWGKPFSALLGAFEAQMGLGLAAIGGKDSMSGSFTYSATDPDSETGEPKPVTTSVPPALVSFAIAPNDAGLIITPEFKEAGHDVVLFEACRDLGAAKSMWKNIRTLIEQKTIVSAWAVTEGGVAEGIFKMALGNEIGFEYAPEVILEAVSNAAPGSIIAEVAHPIKDAITIGCTIADAVIITGNKTLSIASLKAVWEGELEHIFPTKTETCTVPPLLNHEGNERAYPRHNTPTATTNIAKPRALILAFPGTNCEIDVARAITRAGGLAKTVVIRNQTPAMLEDSIAKVTREIKECQILLLPGGSSLGDEPDGSAKFINLFFREPHITDAVHEHIKVKDGLILGICNGFQALVKLGLVPFGEIIAPREEKPTLTINLIGRHQSKYVCTRVASTNSPWMSMSSVGDIHTVAISHGEGRFTASEEQLSMLISGRQIANQYTDIFGEPSMETSVNPNGSLLAIEGILSPDGRVFGKMGHMERYGAHVAKNIYGNKYQPVFESGVYYYK